MMSCAVDNDNDNDNDNKIHFAKYEIFFIRGVV